jgi:hypothetical protein
MFYGAIFCRKVALSRLFEERLSKASRAMYTKLFTVFFAIQLCACGSNLKPDSKAQNSVDNIDHGAQNRIEGIWVKNCNPAQNGTFEHSRLSFDGNQYQLKIERYEDEKCSTPLTENSLTLTSGSFAIGKRDLKTNAQEIDMIQNKKNGKSITRLYRGLLYLKDKALHLVKHKKKTQQHKIESGTEQPKKGNEAYTLQEALTPKLVGVSGDMS